jgi:hypothetical protein
MGKERFKLITLQFSPLLGNTGVFGAYKAKCSLFGAVLAYLI